MEKFPEFLGFSPALFYQKCCRIYEKNLEIPHSHRFRVLSYAQNDSAIIPANVKKELESLKKTFVCIDCRESLNVISPFVHDSEADPFCLNSEPGSSHHFHSQKDSMSLGTPSITGTCCFCSVSITVLVHKPIISETLLSRFIGSIRADPILSGEQASGLRQEDIWAGKYISALDLLLAYMEGVLFEKKMREINSLNNNFNSRFGRFSGSGDIMKALGYSEHNRIFIPPSLSLHESCFRGLLELYFSIDTVVSDKPCNFH
jgi:hypothetical protein